MPALSEELQRKYDSISHTGSERAVLAIALNNPESLFDICTELDVTDFSNHSNKHIYQIMLNILDGKYENISKVNPMVINIAAQRSGISNDDVSMQYLEILQRTDAGEENINFYLGKVKQASIRREAFMNAISVMDESVSREDEESDSFIARQEEKFLDIVMRNNGGDTVIRLGDRIEVVLEQREENPREVRGMPTGFTEYDRQTGGCIPGKLKIWSAVAKTGKSALALNVAKHVAIHERIPTLYIDTEMQTDEQIDRLVSILATELTETVVPEVTVTTGTYTRNSAMKEAVNVAKELIKGSPFYHIYMPDFTAEKVHNLARKFQRQHGITWNGFENQFLLIFDYIKLPDDSSNNNPEYQVLGSIANMLKNKTAGMLNIPVVAFAQLNPRTGYGSSDPNSSHMSGSNRLVMFANELAFLSKKTEEEISQDGAGNGNLIFKLGETRSGGNYKGWINYDTRRGVPSMTEIKNVAFE
jgi:replicative DNA helicase